MKKALMLLTAALLLLGVAACNVTTTTTTTAAPTTTTTTTRANSLPQFTGIADVAIYVGDEFNPLAGISASDAESGNVTANITVSGTVDTENEGTYTLTYTVTDGQGGVSTATRVVTVLDLELVYPTGFYNWKFADTELRHTFMAAAEKYLMNNLYGGVPLFANGSFALYSSRLQLPVDNYVAVMGYGTAFATMSADDSTVLMDDGNPGQAGKYTYRSAITGNPQTFNHWLYNDSVTSEVMGIYLDALYVYHFNADKTGYEVVPSMASGNPVPQNPTTLDTGKVVSKTWQIPLRTDLVWTYHADTDISGLPAGHEVINATDFVETFKLALQEKWFRAISGGGDFCNKSTGIVNACAFSDETVAWEEVGIKKIDDNTIEFTFINDMSDWNVRYWLSSFVMTPINLELYEALKNNEGVSSYGTNEKTIAYHGAYKLDYYEADKILRYSENPNYHNPDEYFYTGYTQVVIRDAAIRFQEFVAGKIEAVALPTAQYDAYKNYPGIRRIPGATTFRLMINGLGTVENQREQFPDGTWIPEPLLANQNFKKAMFFAVDRQKLAEEVLKTSTTQMFLFSDAYLVDPELGIPYRYTAQGESVGEGLSPETFGYNQDAAAAYYRLAIAELIADGVYAKGTAAAPNIINLQLNIFTGSEAQILFGEYMKATFEATFKDYANYVYVTVTVVPRDFPGIYYNYMMTGEFDISIGGISGSTLDAASFLDVFSSDNRGGFTLNWGIDTSMAEIPVKYTTADGVRHLEMWSFDAITSALNGEVYLAQGAEAEVPAANDFVYTPTTVSFTIDLFNSPLYKNIKYTLQAWSNSENDYVNVEGQVEVTPASANVTITGLTPGYSGGLDYLGDYQVIIYYTYVQDDTKSGESVAPWWVQPTIIDDATVVKAETTAEITLVLNTDDVVRTIASVKVFTKAGVEVTAATVSFNGLVVSVSGLTAATDYEVQVTFNDGNIDGVPFKTEAAPAA
jgi:ABC-type oligopeptide transport system substrate-binding subunit